MRVEGISSYYAFMYNRDTKKILSGNEAEDGFADYYNAGLAGIGSDDNPEYSSRKAGIDSLIRFFSNPGTGDNFFNSGQGSDECTIIEEKVSDSETRYYVDGKLMLTSVAGELTANIKLAPADGNPESEELVFDDVSRISISDLEDEENGEGTDSAKRKTGTTSQVIVYPDGSRWLITTTYFCGKEIKITKRLPPLDEQTDEEEDVLRQNGIYEDADAETESLKTEDALDRLLNPYRDDRQYYGTEQMAGENRR